MMYIRDAIINSERLIAHHVKNGHNDQDAMVGVTMEMLRALHLAAEQAQALMKFTDRDGDERVVVVRGFGRDYARVMNKLRHNMGPNEK